VVVVGAGPAGSTAAGQAAALGASTLILERSPKVGEPVRCGEFLPSLDEIKRICEPTVDLEEIFDLPGHVFGAFLERARAYAPSGRVYEVDFQGHSIWRSRLDKHLAKRAEEEGAALWTETPFLELRDGVVRTPRGPVKARVLIGADGPLSTVARAAGFPEHDLLFPALSLPVRGSFEPVFEAFFGGIAPGGYAWIIPRRTDANVGLGVKPDLRQEPLHLSLKRFIRSRGLKAEGRVTGGFVPMSGPLAETVRGNVLLVGDAAGQVLSTSGGGIFTAMICGHLAGRAAARFVLGQGPLEDYERWWRRSVGGALERARALFQAMAPAFEDPESLEEMFRLLGPDGLAASLRCQDLEAGLLRLERPRTR
jgi:digeranylgeranylglycerophospholipid reductase